MSAVQKKNSLLKSIRSTMDEQGMTVSGVARQIEINRTHLSNIFRYPGNPSLVTTLKLLSTTGLDFEITKGKKEKKGLLPRKKNRRSSKAPLSKLARKASMSKKRKGGKKSVSL